MINILNSNIDKFTHILHIGDIHIRLNKRHEEYREIFDKLYIEIDKTPKSTAVAILGDIFHSKSDLSPEGIQLASELFNNIASIRPLIIVAGNHDATLSNKSRLDSLTPIVNALHHSNLYYLKNTGLYGFSNILINNMCVFDDPDKYILGKDIPNIYRNQYEHIIVLFHGPVDQASLDTGYSISNPAIMLPLFNHNDIVLLGDIHKMQDMQDYIPEEHKPRVRYCGSLIMQNHGESLYGHGYSLWDLKSKTYNHHEIPNDYGYFTIEIYNGKLVTDLSNLPKKTHLRVNCYQSIATEVKAVITTVREKTQLCSISYVRMDQEQNKKNITKYFKNVNFTNLTDVSFQRQLLLDFITKKLQITDTKKIDNIIEINNEVNTLIKQDNISYNLSWKPIKFEWDNMFAYGEGNVIDFTNMNGIYGIFGPNKSGKSSILSAIIFCLFDKFDRGFKGNHVLNVQKSSFKCKLEFEVSGVHYFIERIGHTTRTGNVKVDVRFWKNEDGVDVELHGTARRDTNDIIRDYVGTYENFILTVASFQTAKNNSSFIDMGNSDRKDLLVQFIGLNIFDKLCEVANEKNKEINAILKLHKNKNYQTEIQQYTNLFEHTTSVYNELTSEVDNLKQEIKNINENIIDQNSKLVKSDADILNISSLTTQKQSLEEILHQKRNRLENLKVSLISQETDINTIKSEIKKIEDLNLIENYKKYKQFLIELNTITQQLDLKRIEVHGKLDKVEKLKNHKYDPNCKFCIDNSFVKDAIQAKKDLVEDKKIVKKLLIEKENIEKHVDEYKWVEESNVTYTQLLSKLNIVKDKHSNFIRTIMSDTNEIEKLDDKLSKVNTQIELYHNNKLAIENNVNIYSILNLYKNKLSDLEVELQKKETNLRDASGKLILFQSEIDKLNETIKMVSELEYKFDSYQQYLASVGRDGIPYQIICNVVPEIEREVNSILSQIVDFTIQFEIDDKNFIPYIVYTDKGKWPIELSSGYERFVSSIAIRVALTNVSNLPKTTFLAIDEGFSTLDPDNLTSMPVLFTALKNYYDFMLIISHNETLKDAVDTRIEITTDGMLSKVVYE